MRSSLIHGLQRAAKINADGVAVIDGNLQLSWNKVQDRIARLASGLRSLGLAEGERVAVLASNSHRVFELFFATLWAGGVVAPLNNRLATNELAAQVKSAEPRLLFFSQDFADMAESLRTALPELRLVAIDHAEETRRESVEALIATNSAGVASSRQEHDWALLFFTGGTTGEPKGVMLSHANMIANSINFIFEMKLDQTCVHLHCGPLFHVASAARLFSVTQVAGTNVILPRFDPARVIDAIEQSGVTVATFVPTMVRALLDSPRFAGADLATLRYITYGAAPMPERLLRELMERLPTVRLVQSYGMTESSPIATMLGYRDHADPERLRSAGKVALLADIAIVDSENRPLPANTLGEVVISGPMVMLGYWRNPEATEHALNGGWLHTGDIGYLDADNYLYVVDRLKDIIISGGENVYSQEVENVIAAHPDIRTCAVIGRTDDKWGEAVHAVVVLRDGANLTPTEIIAHCRARLSAYKCPKSVDVRHSDLPLSGTNKVNKRQLRQELLAGTASKKD